MDKPLLRILLIDDDEDDYILVRSFLSDISYSRYDLEWVSSYDAAKEILNRFEHDVYLLDYRLGDRNGLDLLHEMAEAGRDAPVIFLTGFGDYRVDIEAMRAGAADYLVKGQIDARVLERSIRYAVERKNAERQLEQSRIVLQKIFDGISDLLIMLDENLLIKMLNKAAREYYGLSDSDDVTGKPCFEAFMGRSSPCEQCKYPFSELTGGVKSFERQGVMDPSRLEQVVVYSVSDISGKPDSLIIRISDITEQKQIERQLVQNEKLAALGLLLSGIAHEINNPNTFITFNIPILRDYIGGVIPFADAYAGERPEFELFGMPYWEFRNDLFKLLDNMEHGSNRINYTLSRLKEFVRKRDKVEKRWTDLREVIEKAVTMCATVIRKKVKSFERRIPENLPRIFTDPEALEQVLVNLLVNAVHASDKPDSWIGLSVELVESPERRLIVEVSDNGCGIDQKTVGRVFDPFFTTKPSTAGTGLGLYVCQNLINALGGEIDVSSEPGRGSRFRISLSAGG